MANIGDIQHNLKTGADSELYFSQVVTTKSSSDYGKIISKLGRYRYPFLSRMTGESIKGSNETLESNELKKGKVPSKKKLGNEMSEGSLDVEFSPTTFDDLIAAALMGKWKPWVSDKNSDINLDKIHCNDGEFLTRAIVSLGKDDYGNWGATYNTKEIFEPRKLLNDGEAGNEDGLISVPKGCVIHELCCGSDDIKFDVLRHLGGHEDEDLYQRYKNLAVNTMSVDIQIGSIVTGSFSFMGSNNPVRVDESNIRKEYGSDESKQFVSEGVTGNSFIDSLPDKSTDTDQFTSMEGNLWVNGKNITTGTSLSMEINNNLERKCNLC
jgi:ribosomal protein S16